MNPGSARHDYPPVFIHIGAERFDRGTGGVSEHVNPATGEVVALIPLAGIAEVDAAVLAADAAFDGWRKWRPADRRAALMRLADLLEHRSDDIARYTTMDNGLPISSTGIHGQLGKEWIAYYAGFCDGRGGPATYDPANLSHHHVEHEPLGVIGLIVTWNFALVGLCMKAGAALAAGNTIVIKPSELAPFSLGVFMDCVRDAEIPAGVVNLLPGGAEAGQALVAHPRVRKISFTGGPEGARKILHACAQHAKPAVVELGGKSANIVFADADLEAAALYAAVFGVVALSGQGCALPTRLLVESPAYDEIIDRVVAIARSIRIGDPWDPETVMGPVVSRAAMDRILARIDAAHVHGEGLLVSGGQRVGGDLSNGFYIEPTVFRDVKNDTPLARQEIFGPVLAITKFGSEEEALALANATDYGLAAFVQTRDLTRAHRVADRLEAGSVLINGGRIVEPVSPFGGRGISGFGREGGAAGLAEFLRPRPVHIWNGTGYRGSSRGIR